MSLKEFIDGGYLQEINRILLHRLGLALAVDDDVDNPEKVTKFEVSILDGRDDDEGWVFDLSKYDVKEMRKKADKVYSELKERDRKRMRSLGFTIQPLEDGA